MLTKLKQIPELYALVVLSLLGGGFFMLTNPAHVPPAALMVGFIIVGASIYVALRLLTRLAGVSDRLSKRQYQLLLVFATLLPIILLALQSLGQLTLRDTLTLVILFGAGYIYLSRMSPR